MYVPVGLDVCSVVLDVCSVGLGVLYDWMYVL
jgi:hypothetical protein